MKWLSALLLIAATSVNTGCNSCGPEQHAIMTGSSGLSMGGSIANRTIQYVTYRLTEPPASHDVFEFVVNALEGSTSGEGVAITISGTDAVTQEIVNLFVALPVALRQGDQYAVGSTFSVDITSPARAGAWGAHDLADPNKADVAFVVATYNFPPATYTPNFTAVSSTGTIRVAGRSQGHLELELDLSFTDANGSVRTLTGPAEANVEKTAALCN